MSLRIDFKPIAAGLDRHRAMVAWGLRQSGSMEAKRLAIRAQQGAPWVDRTAMARRGIHGRCDAQGQGIRIAISGSVYYLTYLEFAHGKKWAILWPTIEAHGAEAIQNIAVFLSNL